VKCKLTIELTFPIDPDGYESTDHQQMAESEKEDFICNPVGYMRAMMGLGEHLEVDVKAQVES